jgi:hypothetical protein
MSKPAVIAAPQAAPAVVFHALVYVLDLAFQTFPKIGQQAAILPIHPDSSVLATACLP